jgi:hypothetical protein
VLIYVDKVSFDFKRFINKIELQEAFFVRREGKLIIRGSKRIQKR